MTAGSRPGHYADVPGTGASELRRVRVAGLLLPDVVLGVAVAVGATVDMVLVGATPLQRPVDVPAVILTVVVGLSLIGRRRWPAGAFATGMTAAAVCTAAGYPGSFAYAFLVVGLFSVGAYTSGRRIVVATTLVAAAAYVVAAVIADHDAFRRIVASPVDATVTVVLLLGPAFVGDVVRVRRHYQVELLQRATRAERLRRLEAEHALADERTRIARELHDVVAHHVSGIVLQAGAAERRAWEGPPPVREALGRIRESGIAALSAMRDVVTVLRIVEADGPVDRHPQPGLQDLGELLSRVEAAGLQVGLIVSGEPIPLSRPLELCAYRIVQESLTNAARHAPGSTVSISLSWELLQLDLRIVDDGHHHGGPREQAVGGGGHGLVGIRERVAALRGRILIGPVDGGWLVHAVLPIEPVVR